MTFVRAKFCLLIALVSVLSLTTSVMSQPGGSDGATELSDKQQEDAWRKCLQEAIQSEQKGDFQQSEQNWQKAVRAADSFTAGDPRLYETLHGAARLYARSDDSRKAIPFFERLIELKKRPLEHLYWGWPWYEVELGDVYYGRKEWSKALENYTGALQFWDLARRWFDMLPVLDKVANCRAETGDLKAAENTYKQVLDLSKQVLVAPGLRLQKNVAEVFTAQTLSDYAKMLNKAGRQTEAVKRENQAKEIWNGLQKQSVQLSKGIKLDSSFESNSKFQSITANDLAKARALERLACYYCQIGKYAEADSLLDYLFSCFNQGNRRQIYSAVEQSRSRCEKLTPASYVAGAGHSKENPYFGKFSQLRSRVQLLSYYNALVGAYAFAVPTSEAITAMRRYQPILELGAGTGYWSHMLQSQGAKTVASDLFPVTNKSRWFPGTNRSWTEVVIGDEKLLEKYPGYTLFLCYPPGDKKLAYNALKIYKGNYFLYVGESKPFYRYFDDFYALLDKEWQLEKQIDIPQWPGHYDALYIYKRKRQAKRD